MSVKLQLQGHPLTQERHTQQLPLKLHHKIPQTQARAPRRGSPTPPPALSFPRPHSPHDESRGGLATGRDEGQGTPPRSTNPHVAEPNEQETGAPLHMIPHARRYEETGRGRIPFRQTIPSLSLPSTLQLRGSPKRAGEK